MVKELVEQGWVVVVYNRRGHKKEELISQKEAESMKSVSLDFVAIERQESATNTSRSQSNSPELRAHCKGLLCDEGKRTPSQPSHRSTEDGAHKRKVWPMYCDMEDMHEVCDCDLCVCGLVLRCPRYICEFL